MQAAQGWAEQKADKNADADMSEYLKTLRCTYGDGKSVKWGPTEVELPGGNDETIAKYRNEYMSLVASLKERKESLNMKPGIESEVIFDKAEMGLYDDENVGITGGTYSSLYRAKALGSEEDQTKISDEQSKSANRLKYGAIAAGAGVAVGLIGNSVINGKLNELIKDAKEKVEDNRANRNTVKALKNGLKSAGLVGVDDLDFSKLDLSGLADFVGKIDFNNMADGLKGKSATDVLNTANKTSFISSLSDILGEKNKSLLIDE